MHKLTSTLFVGPQITLEDVAEIKKQNIKTILCNRPDGEEDGQISQELIRKQCMVHSLDFIYQPVQTSAIDDEDVKNFADNLAKAEAPVLAYCRTGTRCTILWALSQAGKMSQEEILEHAKQAGYDLSRILKS